MKIPHWLIEQVIRRRLRRLDELMRDPAAEQQIALLSLVRRAASTEWGRRHGYNRIRSVRDFQVQVPMTRYEDMASIWHRSFEGTRNLTWPGHIPYFALTSGTTLGASKAMPISREAIRRNRAAGTSLLSFIQRQAPRARLVAGKTLYLGGCTTLERKGACYQGDASGINALHMPRITRSFRLPEPDISALRNWEERVESICQRYLQSPVRAVVGLPSWTLLMLHRLIEIAKERLGRQVEMVADIWPDFTVFVSFGMALAPYRNQLEELVGRPLVCIDTYSSSEGGLNAIQTEQSDPGMQLEIDSGTFFEFVPLEEIDSPAPTRLSLNEVEVDKPYAILLSTVSGIWAYDVGDVVRFTSIKPPKIVFVTRKALQLNTFGEHVLQEHLDNAMAETCRSLGIRVTDFTVTSVLPNSTDPRGCHRWLIEFEGSTPALDSLQVDLDTGVAAASDDYASHRIGDFGMAAPEIVLLKQGTFFEWSKRGNKLGGQHKVPRIATSEKMIGDLLDLSESLRHDEGA